MNKVKRVSVKAEPPVRLEIEYDAGSLPGTGDLPVVEVYINGELAFIGNAPRRLDGTKKITASFDQLKPGANLMRIIIFDYATIHNGHGFNGSSMMEAFDSTNTSLFAGMLEANHRSDATIAYATDTSLVCFTGEQEIEIKCLS